MRKSAAGFTLIELVVVISILAILVAVTIPRFVDLEMEARSESLDSVQSRFTAAVALAHAKWLADGTGVGGTVGLEGATVEVNANGWPSVDSANADQDTAAELYAILMSQPLPAGWTSSQTPAADAGRAQFALAGSGGGSFSYEASTGSVANP